VPETMLACTNTLFRQIDNNQPITKVFKKMGPATKSGTNLHNASRRNEGMNTG